MSNGQVDGLTGRRVNKLYARRDRGMWQVDRRTSGQGNMLLVVEDRVTDEQVRGVTERGEWVGDGRGVGCGRTGSGLGTERERAADRRGVGWGLKVCGLRTEGEWDGGWDGCGLGEEGKWVGENGRHVRGRSILS